MKASEILKAADESKHLQGTYVEGLLESERKYCALGYLACKKGLVSVMHGSNESYLNLNFDSPHSILTYYGIRETRIPNCPVCGYAYLLAGVIIHLNDNHGWTFKQIGEWLEQYE